MLRKICKLGKQILINNTSYKRQFMMNETTNKFMFSAENHHPIIQKILDGEDIRNTDRILTEIGSLDDKNREIALKLILKNIYSNKIPTSTLSNNIFIKQATKSPLIYLDSLSFKLKELMRRLNDQNAKKDKNKQTQAFNQINQTFVLCFQTLNKIPEDQRLKHEVLIYKRFADYNLLYLANLVESSQKKSLLAKCCEFYRKTAGLTDKLLKFQKEKISLEIQYSKNSKEKEEQKSLRLNSMQQTLRMLIETNAQNTLHLFKALNELHDRHKNQTQFDNNIIQMLTSFERAIAWYIILKGFSTHSIFYHRIKKIKIDLNNYYKRSILPKKGGEKLPDSTLQKEYTGDLEGLYTQTKQDLQKISNQEKYVSNAEELSLLMLSIKVQGLKRLKLDESTFKQKLFAEIKAILDLVQHSGNRKAVSSKLGITATQILQNFDKKQNN